MKNANNKKDQSTDLKDPERDEQRLQEKETTIDLPEIKDISGQEHIRVMPLGALADTTISSDDEEGTGLLDDLNSEDDDETEPANDTDISPTELQDLDDAESNMPSEDEQALRDIALDNTDEDGTPLNEKGFNRHRSGSDLDVPGSEEDDADEKIGNEDEENNIYSPAQK